MDIMKLPISCLVISLSIFIYVYICHFFCFEFISSYEILSSSYDDIIFRWYHGIAILRLNRLSLSFFFYIYIINLILMYLMTRNIVFLFGDKIFHWYREIVNLRFDRLSLSLFIYIYIFNSEFDISHAMNHRLLRLTI